jgi:hypothetical protein
VYGILIVLLTAALSYMYETTLNPTDPEARKQVFYKTLLIGGVAVVVITYFLHRQQQPVLTEPYMSEPAIPQPPPV